MNYLAHAFLARATPELLTGGMLGDFVKGEWQLHDYPPDIRAGIHLHRAIDRFTDSHPAVLASRALISPVRRRFAGILVDVFYDHYLARHWGRFSDQPLGEFTGHVYATLWPQRAGFPERLQRILPWMRADDWLASYAEVEAVDAALRGIARRFARYPRAAVLAEGVGELLDNYDALENHFHKFFPEAQFFVEQQGAPDQAA